MKEDTVEELLQQWAAERPGLDVSALGVVVRLQHLGKLLGLRANRALKRHELKHWEYDVLSVLRRQGKPFAMPATDIARAVHLTSGSMTTRIDGLEKRELVERQQSDSDGRSIVVSLSSKGRRLIDEAMHTRLEDANDAMQSLTVGEKKLLAASLQRMLVALEA